MIEKSNFNSKDYAYIAVVIFISFLLTFNLITSSLTQSWGNIYQNIFYLTLIIISLASLGKLVSKHVSSRVKKFSLTDLADFNIFGREINLKRLSLIIATGIAFGTLLAFSHTIISFLSIGYVLPATASITVAGGLAIISTLFVVQIIAAVLEELFRAGALVPTFTKWIKYFNISAMLVFSGLIFALLAQLYAFGIIIIALGILFWIIPPLRKLVFSRYWHVRIAAILIADTIFAAYHAYAYSTLTNVQSALIGVFLFAFIIDIVNYKLFDSTMFGVFAHSSFNGFLYAILFAIPFVYPIFLETSLIIIVLMVFTAKPLKIVR